MSIKRSCYIDGTAEYSRENVCGTLVKWNNACCYGFIVEDNNGKRYLLRDSAITSSDFEQYPCIGQRVGFTAVDTVKNGEVICREAKNAHIFEPVEG